MPGHHPSVLMKEKNTMSLAQSFKTHLVLVAQRPKIAAPPNQLKADQPHPHQVHKRTVSHCATVMRSIRNLWAATSLPCMVFNTSTPATGKMTHISACVLDFR